jgi:hypothetical protein
LADVQREGDPISCGDTHGSANGFRLNGKRVALLGELSAGHAGFPPTPVLAGFSAFRVNGIPIVFAGAVYAPHTRGDTTHAVRLALGSGAGLNVG